MTRNNFLLKSLSLALIATVLSCGRTPEQPNYTFHDLGNLGGSNSTALAVNNHRQVVGWSTRNDEPECLAPGGPRPCEYPFLWVDGNMTDLGHFNPEADYTHAMSINDESVIVGTEIDHTTATDYTTVPFIYFNSTLRLLPLLNNNEVGEAFDINQDGVAVGYSVGSTDIIVTWINQSVTAVEPSDQFYRRSRGINSSGWIVGLQYEKGPFLRPHNGISYRDNEITVLSDLEDVLSEGNAVNDEGIIAGSLAKQFRNPTEATLWIPKLSGELETVMVGGLENHPSSEFLDINNSGVAVGNSSDSSGVSFAVLYKGSKLQNLNDLVSVTKGTFRSGNGINENGDIVGSIEINGNIHAFLLVRNH